MAAAARFTGERCLGIISPSARPLSDVLRKRLEVKLGKLAVISPGNVEELHDTVARSKDEYPLVLVIGGDGTISQVVQHLDLESQILAILPSGTGNDLARGLGLPRRTDCYLKALPDFVLREIDVWLMDGRRFINSAGFGLDAQVLATMASSRGLARQNYVAAFIATLPGLRPLYVRATGNGEVLVDGDVWWLAALNSPFVGGGIPLAPRARLDDGKLDIVAVHACSKWELLLKLPRVTRGHHLKDPRVSCHQAARLTVQSSQQPVAAEGDGELMTLYERRIALVHAGRLSVLCAAAGTR